jgi:NTE family protein
MKQVFLSVLLLFFCTGKIFPQKVGLVLSGGGAKGAVHIGLIKALEENDIPIDYIAGTSIGAIVGSLYAIGYSPDEMLELFMSDAFHYWQTGKVEDVYQFYFRKPAEQPDFMKVMVPIKDSVRTTASIVPVNLINPIQMNQAFMQLYSQANAQCGEDFNRLFVPFLCVASDVYNKRPIIFRKGKLETAVRASMTFPLVFKPIVYDSVPLFDGGIYDNFPVNPMKKAFQPDYIIGSAVTGSTKKRNPEQIDMAVMMENMVMQQTVYHVNKEDGIFVNFALDDVNLLDFYKSRTLYEIGYKRGKELVDSIRKRVSRTVPYDEINARRIDYKENLPPLRFRNIYVTGITDAQKIYVGNQIRRGKDNYFSIEEFKKMYFRLLTNPKIKEIFPSAVYNEEYNVFDLNLDVRIKDEVGIAFGGNISSMSANQLFLALDYQNLSSMASSAALSIQVGNTYTGLGLNGRLELPTPRPMDITATVFHNYRKYFEHETPFIDTDVSTFLHLRETYGKLGVGLPITHRSKIGIEAGYGHLEDKYYRNEINLTVAGGFDKSIYNLMYSGIMYRLFTQDAKQYPLRGRKHHLFIQYLNGTEKYYAPRRNPIENRRISWIQIDGFLNNLHTLSSKFNFGYMVQGVFSTKPLLNNYMASLLQAPAYSPTPHCLLVFNEAFRANNFMAGGVTPIYKINSTFRFQGDFHAFLPIIPLERGMDDVAVNGKMFSRWEYMGEISFVARLPFMNISLFANHYSYPSKNWNVGINIGYLIFGAKFIP